MKKQPSLVLVIFILIASFGFGMSSLTENALEKTQITRDQELIMPQTANLVNHGPIHINNDDLLAFYATSGDGSLETPYIIENWNITTSSTWGIRITTTTMFFIIRNCWITTLGSVYHGIVLEYIAPGTAQLYNNTCVDCGDGIYLFYSDGVIIEQNTCNFNTYNGIHITDSNYVIVRQNICNDNDCGIEAGLSIVNCVFENNTCIKNYYGVQVYGSLNLIFVKNFIANNTHGFQSYTTEMYWCNQTEFKWNKFQYNQYQALELNGMYYFQNEIHHNWFIDNYVGYPQVMDGGGSNHFEKNYWNTWTGPDLDNNGIVDVPYMLDSIDGNADYTPLVVLYEPGIFFQHDPIYIDGNTDFNSTALLEGWFGNGSLSNPFIIQQYQISSPSYAITILNTDYYFIMQNCECTGGLYLSDVSNGQFLNIKFKDITTSASGIAAFNSINCAFNRIFIKNASAYGIFISNGDALQISDNLIQDSAYGVYISGCTNSLFTYNNIVRTAWGYYGLDVSVPLSTIVMYNNYVDIGSTLAGVSEIYSASGFDVNQGHNWYSSAYTPGCDSNNDGYVDTPHFIGGGYYDDYSLASATTMSAPIIEYPIGGSNEAGIVTIKWIPSVDLWSYPITYSIYYSLEGYGWTYLTSGLAMNSFSWDTTTVENGYYKLLVMAETTNGIGAQNVIISSVYIDNHVLISPHVLYPNGYEIVGGVDTIVWDPAYDSWGDSILYTVYYWDGYNGFWQYIGQTYNCFFEWDTNGILYRTDYLIRVVAECAQGLIEEDISDNYFTVQNENHVISSPVITYPNGGEYVSEIVRITWNPASDSLNHSILYSVFYWDGYNSIWKSIGQTYSTSIDWYTHGYVQNRNDYLIRVVAECSDGLTTEDISDFYFSVQNPHIMTTPQVTYPNGGETVSGTIQISWTASTDSLGHIIFYEISYWNGYTWMFLGSTADTYLYWTTTGVPDGSGYQIRVVASCSEGMLAEDVSDIAFTVLNGGHTLSSPQIVLPNGGETMSGTFQISWTVADDNLGHIITYSVYYSSGITDGWVIIGSVTNQNYITWNTHEANIPNRSDYHIKVIAVCDGGLSSEDVSDQIFTILNNPTMTSSGTSDSNGNPFADFSISGYDPHLVSLFFFLITGLYIFLFKKSRH